MNVCLSLRRTFLPVLRVSLVFLPIECVRAPPFDYVCRPVAANIHQER